MRYCEKSKHNSSGLPFRASCPQTFDMYDCTLDRSPALVLTIAFDTVWQDCEKFPRANPLVTFVEQLAAFCVASQSSSFACKAHFNQRCSTCAMMPATPPGLDDKKLMGSIAKPGWARIAALPE